MDICRASPTYKKADAKTDSYFFAHRQSTVRRLIENSMTTDRKTFVIFRKFPDKRLKWLLLVNLLLRYSEICYSRLCRRWKKNFQNTGLFLLFLEISEAYLKSRGHNKANVPETLLSCKNFLVCSLTHRRPVIAVRTTSSKITRTGLCGLPTNCVHVFCRDLQKKSLHSNNL